MNIFSKHFVYLIAFCAVLAIAAFCAERGFPEKTSAASTPDPIASSATTAETAEETVTLSAKGSDVKTWWHGFKWHEDHKYCDGISFHMYSRWEEIAGLMVVGYEHYYDKGAVVLGCPEGGNMVTRGTVWFDLSSIASKAPPLHVFVKRAFLHYKMDKGCDDHQLSIAQEDWLKGYPANKLVPGDDFARIPASCASEGKSPSDAVCAPEDVAKVLNNWIKGADNGGYANYGFVFSGITEDDIRWPDNEACWTRFSDFSLTVTYEYDKAPAPPFSAPPAPRKNVALASNGATATAQNYTADGVYPGSHFQPSYAIDGKRYAHLAPPPNDADGFWRDEHGLSSWLQIDFSGSKTIDEVDIFTMPDHPDYLKQEDPTPTLTFKTYGATAFDVQYWTGSDWETVPGIGSIIDNNLVWKKLSFSAPVTTSRIRVLVNASRDKVARIVEVEAWTKKPKFG